MAADTTTAADAQPAEVVASVDPSPGGSRFVIADITRDGAWLSVGEQDAPDLPDWR
jgi:hypothetical protein